MDIIETDSKRYKDVFPATNHVFNSIDFNILNAAKCEKLLFLIFKDTKSRLGLIAGVNENELHSPFSAPFGGFSFLKEDITITKIEAAVEALIKYAADNGYRKIKYTMPPLFYNELFNSKLLNVFYRKSFSTSAIDLNYQFNLEKMEDDYEKNIWYNARKNLNISFKQEFDFIKCETEELKTEAYEVIKENRSRKGFPLRMNYEQVKSTTEIIEADFFMVKKEKQNVASAQIFYVAPQIVQVIYWGDIPDFASQKPMNFLACSVFRYYKDRGIKFIDIGPSTENSIPNYGLCEFKESIGCDVTPKFSFTKFIV